jgi:hypothetical protein
LVSIEIKKRRGRSFLNRLLKFLSGLDLDRLKFDRSWSLSLCFLA